MNEERIDGQCKCGRAVTKILNSSTPTFRADGTRYIYPNKPDTGWCIFRCEDCTAPITESWEPAEVTK